MDCVLYIDDLFTGVQGTCLRFPHHMSFLSLSRCHQTHQSPFPLTAEHLPLSPPLHVLCSLQPQSQQAGEGNERKSLYSKRRHIFPLFLKADYKHTTHKYTLLQSHHHIWGRKNANTSTHIHTHTPKAEDSNQCRPVTVQ